MRQSLLSSIAAVFLLMSPVQAAEPPGGLGIAAIVNDEIISSLDLEDRLTVAIGTTGLSNTPEVKEKLRPQILRQLVDDKLKMQQATKRGITVTDQDLAMAIANLEKQNRREPGSFEAYLREKHLPPRSSYDQIKAQIAWSKLVMKELRPRVNVSEEEVALKKPTAISQKAAPAVRREILISPIILPVDKPANEDSVRKLADKLVNEIRAGAKFEAVAAQFSGGASSGTAPEPFWVQSDQVDALVSKGIANVKAGGISDAIRTQNGYQIIKIVEEKNVSAAAPSNDDDVDAELAMKKIVLKLKPDADNKEANLLLKIAKSVKANPGTCKDKGVAGFTAEEAKAAEIDVDFIRSPASQLPDPVKGLVTVLSVGQVSEPFASPEGLHLLMLCEKIELPTSFVDHEKARAMLLQEKLDLEAIKYLRNLRREAFIDIRS